jgi:hypothetical protein
VNEKLDKILADFFEENQIENYKIEEIKLNIIGNFIIHKNQNH